MKKFNSLFIFGFIALLLMLIGTITPISFLRNKARQTFAPLNRTIYRADNSGSRTIAIFSQIRDLLKDNSDLKAKNSQLNAKIITLQEKAAINKDLIAQYNIDGNNPNLKYQAAQVVGRSPSVQRDILTLNKGSQDNIKKNQPVMSGGFLIGKISQVTANSAQVELITNSRFIIPVILQNSRKAGLLSGGLKGLIIEQLPTDTTISPNEAVVTSGLADELPAGLPIGTVGETVSKPSDIFKSVLLVSPINISSVETVFVLESK